MASIGWIDFSKNDKNRVGSVLDLLTPEGMVDELGMGTIRDALANQIFPGISTIQTRAKYFFIVPYILYDYQALKSAQRKNKTPVQYLEQREYEIMWELAERYEYKEGEGVIGISKRKPQKIVRRPSAIYWNGLHTFQFIHTNGLAADVFLNRAVNPSVESLLSNVDSGDDNQGDDADAEHENLFRLKVPPKPNWSVDLRLDLDATEADFFHDRILSVCKGKLIAEILQREDLWKIFEQAKNFTQFAAAAMSCSLPGEIEKMVVLAHDFSEMLYGAHLAYNCLLQKRGFNSNEFEDEFRTWSEGIGNNMLDYSRFNPDMLFSYATSTRPTTMQFVREWWKLTQVGFKDMTNRNTLIEQQEAMVKGGKARLRWNKMDDVEEDRWLGLTHFEYRFFQARRILGDIHEARNK
jgi:hypothetical protein